MRVTKNVRLWLVGSCCRWFWLAIAISGRSQQDSTINGAEIMSMLKYWEAKDVFWSIGCFSHVRLIIARIIELVVYVKNSLFGLDKSAVGISRAVGSKIFNIVGGLGSVSDLLRGFVMLPPVGLGLCLLRRQRMLVVELGLWLWRVVEGLRKALSGL